ncbi:filamentous hemagglutinin N-terminal domain-containing protein [Halomonas sp. KM-1]|uniref:two-partner secretion domain-containing protein n=1 Tax=Halomonas sp. KM-1 TaxID=590061 RepID=UPI000289B494|nr:filamentous hemagglutinin N-terminal domain-containing protein [Halomonas sp. KM-1]
MYRKQKKNSSVIVAVSVIGLGHATGAIAAPTNGEVARGTASISTHGLETLINQTSQKAVINWDTFNISTDELVRFVQNNASDIALNRVVGGGGASQILGGLQANGRVFLINPNGILFGAGAQVDVAGLVATTFDIADDDFIDGRFHFSQSDNLAASVRNQGTITIGDNGFLYLIAPTVENSGSIVANLGKVSLAHDGSYRLDLQGNDLINFSVPVGLVGHISNSGNINGQTVALGADLANAVMTSVVNTGNITAATSLTMTGGSVQQYGSVVAESARVEATASISGAGLIEAETVSLQAGTGIGTQAQAIRTRAEHLDATLTDNVGGVYINELDGLESLTVDVASRPVSIEMDEHHHLRLEFDSQSRLSTNGPNTTDIAFTNRNGGVTLSGVSAGDLSVTAQGNIVSDSAVAGSTATASNLYLEVTGEGSTIGAEGSPLRVDATTLSAHANRGHIVVTDVAGGVALNEIDTGSNSAEDGLRAIIKAENGSITSANTTTPNVTAWATNLEADGAIGSAGQAITTSVDVLNASTQNGGIHVEDQQGQLVVGNVTARERIMVGGQPVASAAISNANGQITLSDGTTVGQHDVSIRSQGDMFLTGTVSATDALVVQSQQGAIMAADDAVSLVGRSIDLTANDRIGVDGASLRTQSNIVNANSGNGGVFITESNGLTVGTIVAQGDDNNVKLSATQGDVQLGFIDAVGGQVSVESVNGRILDNNGAALNVRADAVAFTAKGAIGAAANAIETHARTLTTRTRDQGVGTFIDNVGAAEALSATTNRGSVAIANANGVLAFNGTNGQLTLNNGGLASELDLDFTNTGGDIVLGNIDLGDNDARLNASGSITQGAGALLTADSATLQAGRHIGSGAQAVRTDVSSLDLTTLDGNIFVDNLSSGRLQLNAQASGTGEAGSVSVTHAGDMAVGSVNSRRSTTLRAVGSIEGEDDSGAYRVTADGMSLEADAIGSAELAFSTRATGNVSLLAREGDIYLTNLGAMQLVDAQAAGQVDLVNHGDLILGRLEAGEDVELAVQGRVTDGNGGGLNILARGLKVNATQFGTANDAIEMMVDNLVIDTTNGGIYAYQSGHVPLNLHRAQSSGSGSDIRIGADGDIALGTVSAAGNGVELRSGGSIEDARGSGVTAPNVRARSLEIAAENGVGANGDLALDVSFLSASGGTGDVNASNLGAIAVDRNTLVGKGASGVSIIATSITILDNKGGVITMDGGRLVLTATDGNIVFLNQNDTIYLPGGGSITLTALSKSELDGYRGSIIVGNLTTDGGDISLHAESNITIGMLDARGNATQAGDIWVESRNGVILDGNGTNANLRGDHVTLIANTPGHREAELVRDTAIAEYSARVAEANAKASVLEILEQQLQSHIVMASNAAVLQGIAQYNRTTKQYEVNRAARDVALAEAIVDTLNTTLNALTVVRNAAAIVTGAMQAVPFSGDAGADAAFAVVDLAMSVAAMALDEYERYNLGPKQAALDSLNNELDQAIANLYSATNLLNHANALRDTTQVSRNIADLAHFNAVVARDASQQLRRQAVAAFDLNQDIDMSAAKPLGIEANRLDMRTGSGRDLNSGVYLNSQGDLGLGNIASSGSVRVTDVQGNISIVGEVKSPDSITLQAGGAIRGAGGTWVNGLWVPSSGQLIAPDLLAIAGGGVGMDQAVRTRVDRLAVDAGTGGVHVFNRNAGQALVVDSLGSTVGISGDGDITLDTDGDLVLNQGIKDTDLASENTIRLESGGAIVDGNGSARNVEAQRVVAYAVNSIELDTATQDLTAHVSGSGNITLREHDDIHLRDLVADNISVTAGGHIEVGSLAADLEQGNIVLAAGGRIDNDQDTSTRVIGNRLSLTAGGSIGATGSNATRSLDTSVATLVANAGGEVNIAEYDDLVIESLETTAGNVTVESATGSLQVGRIVTGTDDETITLVAHEAINATGDSPANLTAADLSLHAGTGIGNVQGLKVNAERLVAEAGAGGIVVSDLSGDLRIGGVTPNLGRGPIEGLRAAGGEIRVSAESGKLYVDEHVINFDGDVVLSGSAGVTQEAYVLAQHGDVAVSSSAGSIAMAEGALTAATHSVSYEADGDLHVTEVFAQDVVLTASNGALTAADGVARNVIAEGLDVTAANGIGTSAGALKTDVDRLSASVTGSGNVFIEEHDDVLLTRVSNANGDVHVAAGGDIDIQRIDARNGRVDMYSEGQVSTVGQGRISAKDLSVIAEHGIDVSTQVERAALLVQQAGGIKVSETDAIDLLQVITTDGNVSVTAGGRIGVESVEAGGANSAIDLTSGGAIVQRSGKGGGNGLLANTVTLNAASGIGNDSGGALKVDTDRLVARTQSGNVLLDAASGLFLEDIRSGNGNVSALVRNGDATVGRISSSNAVDLAVLAGALRDDGNASTRIAANRLTLSSRDGIGTNAAAMQTDVNSLAATVTGAGGIFLDERNGLSRLSAATTSGNIRVRALDGGMGVDRVTAGGEGSLVSLEARNGSIRDVNNDTRVNVAGERIQLKASNGVGQAGNALDVDARRLVADGGAGGVYLNSLSSSLILGGLGGQQEALKSRGGDIVLTTAGDLDVQQGIATGNGGNVSLTAKGGVTQQADISTAGNGNIAVTGGTHVVMSPEVTTKAGRGHVSYSAGDLLTVSNITTSTGLNGGRVTLQAPRLVSNASEPGSVQAGFVNVVSPQASDDMLKRLVGDTADQSRLSINDRMAGGRLADDRSFMETLLLPSVMSAPRTEGVVSSADLNPFFGTEGLRNSAFDTTGADGVWVFQPK